MPYIHAGPWLRNQTIEIKTGSVKWRIVYFKKLGRCAVGRPEKVCLENIQTKRRDFVDVPELEDWLNSGVVRLSNDAQT